MLTLYRGKGIIVCGLMKPKLTVARLEQKYAQLERKRKRILKRIRALDKEETRIFHLSENVRDAIIVLKNQDGRYS